MKKIIIIEERNIIENFSKRILMVNLFNISFVNSFEQLETAFTENLPDLFLIDTSLTRMNANNILKTLKLRPDTSSIPVIMISNLHNIENSKSGIEEGAVDYIFAPFEKQEFLRKINKVLNS